MKNLNKLTAAIVAGTMLAGCNDLDIQPQGSTITSDQKQEVVNLDPGKALASVSGLSGMMTAYGSLTGGSGSDHHEDIGIPALFILMDERGMDMYSIESGYNWYNYAMLMSDGLPTSLSTNLMWRYNYNIIYSANEILTTVLPTIDEDSTTDENYELMFYAGEALAFRAFSYTYLAQSYQFTYTGHESSPCVPIITEKNSLDAAANGCARSTVKEVYDQIISDLTQAISYLEGNPVTPDKVISSKPNRFVTAAAAYGLRARAYLLMNEWAKAASDAQAAISKSGATPLSRSEAGVPGFISLDEHNWLWGIAVSETDRVSISGICNFPSHMGSLSYGYASAVGAWKWINTKLYNQIPSTDIRKGWWLNSRGTSGNLTAAQQSYVSQNGASAGVQVKFAPYNGEIGGTVNASDIPLMRVEELYLILAEAQGMQDVATGVQTLNDFVTTYRDATYECTATTKEAFQDAVWFQRRIELWGEGFSYFDMLRLGKALDRVNAGWPSTCEYYLEPTDPVLIFPIPDGEITANQQLNSAENTLGGGRPTPVNGSTGEE